MPFFRRLLISIGLVACLCIAVFGLDTPTVFDVQGSGFISVSDSSLGSVDIMLPVAQLSNYLTLDGHGVPFNASATTVTGYVFDSSGTQIYTVRWPAWSYAEYRPTSGSYNYSSLNISGVSSSNVQWLTYSDISGPSASSWRLIFLAVLFMGVIVCFIKR